MALKGRSIRIVVGGCCTPIGTASAAGLVRRGRRRVSLVLSAKKMLNQLVRNLRSCQRRQTHMVVWSNMTAAAAARQGSHQRRVVVVTCQPVESRGRPSGQKGGRKRWKRQELLLKHTLTNPSCASGVRELISRGNMGPASCCGGSGESIHQATTLVTCIRQAVSKIARCRLQSWSQETRRRAAMGKKLRGVAKKAASQ
jgi:hypothetical protein